jgi:hypothetical protein
MAGVAMRARRPAVAALSSLAVLLLLLAIGIAVDCRLSAVWRVALDSIDDPVAQEHDEAAPADAPSQHRGGEAAAWVAQAITTLGRLTLTTDSAVSLDVRVVSVPRAPPAA